MHVLLENGFIVAGPYPYNARKFQSILDDDYEIKQTLPATIELPLVINEELTLAPVISQLHDAFNPEVQQLVGPYPTLVETGVELRYDVISRDLDSVKNEIKSRIKAARQVKEVAGTALTINGVELNAPTDRESRAILAQALQLSAFDKNWKFDDVWVVLNQADLVAVISAIAAHVQSVFDWEKSKLDELAAVLDVLLLAEFVVVPVAPMIQPEMI